MMKIQNMRDKEVLARQYQDSTKLDIRRNFQKKYGTNPVEYADWILSKIKFFNGCRVLEVGCGTGSLWQDHPELVDTFAELVLTDISRGMIDIARQCHAGRKNVHIQVMDVLDVPFEAHSFDIIVANSMLYHVQDVNAALENVQRVLRDEGAFHATTFGKGGLIHYINHAMVEMGLSDSEEVDEISFTLENGGGLLRKHFSAVGKETYDGHLEVSDPVDLVEYIFSMASMCHVDRSNRERMTAYFETKKDSQGILAIAQTSGMFICSNA